MYLGQAKKMFTLPSTIFQQITANIKDATDMKHFISL